MVCMRHPLKIRGCFFEVFDIQHSFSPSRHTKKVGIRITMMNPHISATPTMNIHTIAIIIPKVFPPFWKEVQHLIK